MVLCIEISIGKVLVTSFLLLFVLEYDWKSLALRLLLLTPYYKVFLHTAKQHSIIQSTAKFYAVLQSPNPFDSRKT